MNNPLRAIRNVPSLGLFTLEGLPGSPEMINIWALLESLSAFQNDLDFSQIKDIKCEQQLGSGLAGGLLSCRGRNAHWTLFRRPCPGE
jgi:hypothetical protein